MQLPRQVHTLFHHPQGMERIRKHPFLFRPAPPGLAPPLPRSRRIFSLSVHLREHNWGPSGTLSQLEGGRRGPR